MKVTCEPKHIRTVNSDKTSKLAYASITLDDAFVVHGLSIINGREGLFVSMPQQSYVDSEGEKKYSDTAFQGPARQHFLCRYQGLPPENPRKRCREHRHEYCS